MHLSELHRIEPLPVQRVAVFRYAALALEASQASISDSFQRVQPGVRRIGLGKVGSVLSQRRGVKWWTL